MSKLLLKMGYTVKVAFSGEEALEAAKQPHQESTPTWVGEILYRAENLTIVWVIR